MATATDGMHPTGMHSCSENLFYKKSLPIRRITKFLRNLPICKNQFTYLFWPL